jgi:cytidine deaminase
MKNRREQFEAELKRFPEPVGKLLWNIPLQGGVLLPDQVHAVMDRLSIDANKLMVRLLPLASIFAVAPISEFHVGAVALAESGMNHQEKRLYLGANMEFENLDLSMTIHAEQAAVINAWHQNGQHLQAVATSEPPCGYCRQFLKETANSSDLIVIRPSSNRQDYHHHPLVELLPYAIAPQDLGNQSGLMASTSQPQELSLKFKNDDPAIEKALFAAQRSYAPYTHNFSGCAIQTDDETIFSGRYAESVAFNPSLSPIHSALVRLNMATLDEERSIKRAVLIEKPTTIQQRKSAEQLLASWTPDVELEYHTLA